ncbi:hypothetical protein KC328_g70 [Hortaea werneckii]|nr:hypothetical protein KC328_g70 [Hortaea werneckii]
MRSIADASAMQAKPLAALRSRYPATSSAVDGRTRIMFGPKLEPVSMIEKVEVRQPSLTALPLECPLVLQLFAAVETSDPFCPIQLVGAHSRFDYPNRICEDCGEYARHS